MTKDLQGRWLAWCERAKKTEGLAFARKISFFHFVIREWKSFNGMIVSVEQTRKKTGGLTLSIHVHYVCTCGRRERVASSQRETIEWFDDGKGEESPYIENTLLSP